MSSVSVCDVKNGSGRGEVVGNDRVVGMLSGREKEDVTGVWGLESGSVRIENGGIW